MVSRSSTSNFSESSSYSMIMMEQAEKVKGLQPMPLHQIAKSERSHSLLRLLSKKPRSKSSDELIRYQDEKRSIRKRFGAFFSRREKQIEQRDLSEDVSMVFEKTIVEGLNDSSWTEDESENPILMGDLAIYFRDPVQNLLSRFKDKTFIQNEAYEHSEMISQTKEELSAEIKQCQEYLNKARNPSIRNSELELLLAAQSRMEKLHLCNGYSMRGRRGSVLEPHQLEILRQKLKIDPLTEPGKILVVYKCTLKVLNTRNFYRFRKEGHIRCGDLDLHFLTTRQHLELLD